LFNINTRLICGHRTHAT